MLYLELSEETRTSLLRGFVERSWHAPDLGADEAALVRARIVDVQAHADGLRLRNALDAVAAAVSFAELNAAECAYDDLAAELNARYGEGLVVRARDAEELGIRGFRGQGFETRSSVLVGEERVAS